MHSSIFAEAGNGAGEKIRAFVICVDNRAAAHVTWLKNQLAGLAVNGLDFSCETWRLDTVLGRSPIAETIAWKAASSDILVVATTALDRRDPALFEWLNSLAPAHGDRKSYGLLLGLLGDQKNRAAELR